MGSRAQLVQALRDLVPETYDVKSKPIPISQPEPTTKCVLVVERQTVSPAPNQGSFFEEHHIWVIQPSQDVDVVDDLLDDNLEVVLDALRALSWLSFEMATRSVFREKYHAYDVTITVVTTTEKE